MKKLTVSKAKKDAWKHFSLYIRARDCGFSDQGPCFTCGKVYPLKLLQAGHWIPGRHNAVLFDERNVHAQCYHCNVGLKGNPIVYYDKMLKIYGSDICEELKSLDSQLRQFKVPDLIELADYYKQLLKVGANG